MRATEAHTRSIILEDQKEPRLQVTDFQWRVGEAAETAYNSLEGKASGAPLTLLATMQIGYATFHVEAFLVEYRRKGRLFKSRAVTGMCATGEETIELRRNDEATGWLWRAHGMDGYCETVVIPGIGRGREYAIFVSPFCR